MDIENYLRESVESDSIYIDKNVLRSDTLPSSLKYVLHREDEVKKLGLYLKDLIKGLVPTNLLITGKNGTGKTLIVSMILDFYTSLSEKENEFFTIFVHCNGFRTDVSLLRFLVSELERKLDIPRQKCPYNNDELLALFFRLRDQYEGNVVIVFDEVNLLRNINRLSDFYRAREDHRCEKRFCIIGITNDVQISGDFDARTATSSKYDDILFHPYHAEQLADILKDRADRGLINGACCDGVIELCAALAAQKSGDARRAIDLLRISAEIAESALRMKITEDDVRTAEKRIEANKIRSIIMSYPIHAHIILQAIVLLREHGKRRVTSGELYKMYSQVAGFVNMDVTTERYVLEIVTELEGMGLISTSLISRGRYGRSKEISLSIPVEFTANVLKELDRFADIDKFRPVIQSQTHL